MQFTQAEGHDVTTQPQAPSQAGAKAFSKVQLKKASYDEGSAFLAPVQAKGGITIGAHKNTPPAPAPKSGITIGAHKAPPTAAPPAGGGAQPVGSNAPQPGGFVGASPTAAPGQAASGIAIGGHKQPPPAGGASSGAGAPMHTPPNKPLPPVPGQVGAAGGMQAPPNKPLPPTPGQAGAAGGMQAPPNKPLPPTPGQGGPQQAVAGPAVGAQAGAAPQQVVVAPPPDPAQLEQQAQEEDKKALHDIDKAIDVFADEGRTAQYFSSTAPNAWHAQQPDYDLVEDECTRKGVTRFELYALVGYTGPGYVPMNRLERGKMASQRFTTMFKPYSKAATTAMGKLGTPTVKRTQRGWRSIDKGDPNVVESMYHREFVEEQGYLSTTTNSSQNFFAGPVSFQIAGKSGVDLELLSMVPSEGEVLYAPKTHFKVTRFQRNADVEAAWSAWHKNEKANPKPGKPWFEIDLEEK